MMIRKICILGLEDFPLLVGDSSLGHVGGESVQHLLLARAWRDLGLQVSIIVLDHGQPRVMDIDGVHVVAAFARGAGLPLLRFAHPRMTGVLRAMRYVDADVYYQSPASAYTGVAVGFARRHGKQSVVRIASDFDCVRGEQPIRYWRDRRLFDYGLRNASLVAAQTNHQRALIEKHYGTHSDILNVVVEIPSAANPVGGEDIDVLWVGNMRPVKRPDLALALARILPEYRFTIVGGSLPGYESYFEKLMDEAAQLPNVRVPGAVRYQDVGSFFDRARVHLNTSDIEGFPNTFLQAWVRARPVVSFFDPDLLIRQRNLGRQCADIEEMALAIRGLLSDPLECAGIGARARAFSTAEFSASHVARRYLDLLEARKTANASGARVQVLANGP